MKNNRNPWAGPTHFNLTTKRWVTPEAPKAMTPETGKELDRLAKEHQSNSVKTSIDRIGDCLDHSVPSLSVTREEQSEDDLAKQLGIW